MFARACVASVAVDAASQLPPPRARQSDACRCRNSGHAGVVRPGRRTRGPSTAMPALDPPEVLDVQLWMCGSSTPVDEVCTHARASFMRYALERASTHGRMHTP